MMKNAIKITALAAALLLALTLVGCGGTGSETTTPANTTEAPAPQTEPAPEILAVAGIEMNDKTLTVADENHETFEVNGKIRVTQGAEWAIFRDEGCTDAVGSTVVTLEAGENLFWIKLTLGDQSNIYKLVITRSETVITAYVPEDTTSPETEPSGPVEIPTTPETPFTVTDKGAGDEVDFPG